MATYKSRPFARVRTEELKDGFQELLINAGWKLAHCALWPEQSFDADEERAVKEYIREYFTAAVDLRRAFISFIQRIVLTQKYAFRSQEGSLPKPSIWFNNRYPFGFIGTLLWLHGVELQRKEVPGYLAHIEELAYGYFQYSIYPSIARFRRCRKKLLQHHATSLLQLFYNTIIYSNFLNH